MLQASKTLALSQGNKDYNDKASKMGDKLSKLNSLIEQEITNVTNKFEPKIKELDDKIMKWSNKENQREFGINEFKNRIVELLDKQSSIRRNTEKNKLLNLLDEKASACRSDIAKESKNIAECVEQLNFHLDFVQDYRDLDETDNEIMKRVEQETTRFEDTLEELRTSLSETEKAMNEIIHTTLSNF